MLVLILLLIVAGVVAAAAALWSERKGDHTPIVEKAATKPIEYYDDEELDRFRGTASDNYSDEDADMFADVLYTMRSDEVAGWCRSLHLRGVELPDQLKDEVTMMISEAATAAQP